MSLASLNFGPAANAGSAVHLLHPISKEPLFTADKKAVTISVLGIDSDTYVAAERVNRDEIVEANRKGTDFKADVQDARATRLLVACTTGWANIPRAWIDGSDKVDPIDFTPAHATALYDNPGVSWIRDQVDRAIADRSRFLPS